MTEKRNVRVLVLEDSPERIKRFKAYFGVNDHFVFEADFTDDADQAIALFQQNPYDLLFLDHDLGEGSNPDPENNGARFTSALISRLDTSACSFAGVHSLNFCAASRMVHDIKQAGIATVPLPFVWNDMGHAMGLFRRVLEKKGEEGR